MDIQQTKIEGLQIITPDLFGDDRGFFVENFQSERYAEICGKEHTFVQDNISRSQKGVLRGLHFQNAPHAQGKLVSVISGAVYDVAVDLREGSETYGQWFGVELRAPEHTEGWQWTQFWIPPGFAHGFLALEDDTTFAYKCTDVYAPDCDAGLMWNDSELGITWPDLGMDYIISDKDKKHPTLQELKK